MISHRLLGMKQWTVYVFIVKLKTTLMFAEACLLATEGTLSHAIALLFERLPRISFTYKNHI